jgi:hypothetical protein
MGAVMIDNGGISACREISRSTPLLLTADRAQIAKVWEFDRHSNI